MRLGWTIASLLAILLMDGVPASAQALEFVGNLTSDARPFSPGVVVQPFVGDTGASGWATVTLDASQRTLSYRVTVVNLSGPLTGRLFVAAAVGTAVPVATFTPAAPTSIVLNNRLDDLCYDVSAVTFEGTVSPSDFTLAPGAGIRAVEDVFAAVREGKAYVHVGSSEKPDDSLLGWLGRKIP